MRNSPPVPPPNWDPREPSARVLMEYLKRASPEFVATELEQLGLLRDADAAADRMLRKLMSLEGGLQAERFDRQIAAVLEQHGVRLADDAPPSRWRRYEAGLRRAVPAAALCALIGIVLAVDARWAPTLSEAPALPPHTVRERVYKEYTVLENPVADGARHGVDRAALRRLGRGMRERGIDAARLDVGAAVALEYEVLLEPATGEARFAGLISASVAGQDVQFAEYAAGEGLRAKEGL